MKTGTTSQTLQLPSYLYQGTFGVEVEEHRVSSRHQSLSQQLHPASLGERRGHVFFQNDFAESQEELVTLPHHSTRSCLNHLHTLQAVLQQALPDDDLIWPLSMPPRLGETDLNYLPQGFRARPWYQKYLEKMLEKYGPFYGLMCGVHVNYAPTTALLSWYQNQHHLTDVVQARNQMLFQIVQQVLGYRWLLTYLFGAAPISENPGDTIPTDLRGLQPVRSFRSSKYGFNNDANFEPDYSSFTHFVNQLEHYVATGDLVAPSDFHGPIRLKGVPTFAALQEVGAQYLEFRFFDLNPFSQDGINQLTLSFLHLLVMDAVVNPRQWEKATLSQAADYHDRVALQHPETPVTASANAQVEQLWQRLDKIVAAAPADLRISLNKALNFAKMAVHNPEQTVSGKLVTFMEHGSLMNYGLRRGRMLKRDYQVEPQLAQVKNVPEQWQGCYRDCCRHGWKADVKDEQLLVKCNQNSYTLSNKAQFEELLQRLTEKGR
ncbi:glutamate--cysteine ligase [Fructilactobacillus carniphilus]|uniref:Glutamate--cysteine ligase n=1 Tax=Fructilactobacillus carniphilus TaxID=2940297 RepID=A0ABY5BZQ3_9LACO|nr:glutamate--cysteine ligase [Fructilactobacillus carniphilus]USS91335.1 glutamate--cysteine ligase [Fructilactobacillus carniphilus]